MKKYAITLVQDPYLSGTTELPVYVASGYLDNEDQDEETGPTVEVIWHTVEGWREMDDASDHCSWHKPHSVIHFRLGDITSDSNVC